MRYFFEIAYKGTNYVGWQVQPNGISVQQKMDEALSTLLRDNIHCIGCGRTDAGVHASQFYLHFDTEKTFPENFLHRINNFLPDDIAVKRIIPVHEKAHTRFDAVMRTYQYYIRAEKDVFGYGLSIHKPYYDLNFDLMQEACMIVKKYTDFASFCKSKQGSKTTIVHIREAYWMHDENNNWTFYISADRFLRGMVRLMVGAMIQIGKGKMTLEEFDEGIREKQRFRMAMSAPAEALFLTGVKYDYITEDK